MQVEFFLLILSTLFFASTYVFPILRYHDRLRDLGEEDFKYFFASPRITTDGSYLRDGVLAGNEQIVAKPDRKSVV